MNSEPTKRVRLCAYITPHREAQILNWKNNKKNTFLTPVPQEKKKKDELDVRFVSFCGEETKIKVK